MSKLQAIQTRYNNHHFRSRREARWAVFFDTLGLDYEYEPEGFDLGEEGWYLPDFYLPQFDSWFEVKPTPDLVSDDDKAKMRALSIASEKRLFVFYKCAIPNVRWRDWIPHCNHYGHYYVPDGEFDGIMSFGYCDSCNQITIGHFGCHHIFSGEISYDFATKCSGGYEYDPKILAAFRAAQEARF